mgnify:CR=1 FL=1
MQTILTLDYELSFGKKTGTPQVAIIEATNKLLTVLDRYNAKAVFFVDATYLLRLKELSSIDNNLQQDYDDVVSHIQELECKGHQIQLHIHPHWVDSTFGDNRWNINAKRYRLSNWSKGEAKDIINRCVTELNKHLTNPVFAFRAGGWSIQPFNHIKEALKQNNIWLDSTVFNKGRSLSDTHSFDFLAAPKKTHWQFNDDPCIEDPDGFFTEIAISSRRVSPLFY